MLPIKEIMPFQCYLLPSYGINNKIDPNNEILQTATVHSDESANLHFFRYICLERHICDAEARRFILSCKIW